MLNFNTNQCVQVNNKQEFDKIYPFLRSAEKGVSLEEWINEVNKGYPSFPIFLEQAKSVTRGNFIAFTSEPKNTWTNTDYEIISVSVALGETDDTVSNHADTTTKNLIEPTYSKNEVKSLIQAIYSEFAEAPISMHTTYGLRDIIQREVEQHPLKPIKIFK